MNNFRAAVFFATLIICCTATAEEAEEPKWDVNNPPGVHRSISIDTREGTWMSLDVSPDGQTIAFDLLGDIYTLPIEGGAAESINSGLAWSMQPRFSPDGSEIAFISDSGGGENVWIMAVDGSDARQVTHEDFRLLNNPYWSPDGNFIAARKHFTTTRSLGTGEIWLYHRNGGGGVPVVEKPSEGHQKELGEPAFSPDGRFIYFSVDSTPGSRFIYAQDSNAQIFEIRRHDLDTGETVSFVTGAGGAVRPAPSPDGRYLAFVRRIRAKSALFIKDLTSGRESPLYTELDQDNQEVWGVQGIYPNMDWTPDSRNIVFWAGGKIRKIDVRTKEVSDIEFHVQDTRTVLDAPRPAVEVAPDSFATTMVRNAEVSPDGSKVVFESAGYLYLMNLPNGRPERLTRDGDERFEYDPSWSRNGDRIAFVAWSDDELGHIHTVRGSGGRSERITENPGHYHGPRFSPDGESIVYEATDGGYLTSPDWSVETGVFIVDADGDDSRRITANGSNPHFGARGDRLFVTRRSDNGNGRSLVSIDLSGEAAREHASGKTLLRYEVAPDGKHLAFRENYHIYAIPMPRGGNPIDISTAVSSLPMTMASGDGGNFPHWSTGGAVLHWSLGADLFGAGVRELFAPADEGGESGYEAAPRIASMSMQLPADKPDSTVVLHGGKVVTMSQEDGGIIENGIVVIENNRITEVGASGSAQIPDDAIEVDVSGKTIVPGFIDAHAHGSQGVGIIPQQNWITYATLALGVTTVHDPSNDATEVFAAAEMQRTGQILAPRIFSTGNIVYGAKSTYYADVQSIDDARKHVRRLKAQGAMSVKNYNQPRRNQRQQVAEAAREEGMLVVAEGGSLFHMDLSIVTDGNSTIEHNLPQSMLYEDVLQLWSQTNVAYTPTLVVTYGGLRAEDYWYQESDVWKHPILANFVPPHVLQPRSVRRITAPDEDFYHTRAAATAKLLADRGIHVSIGAHGQREGLASHWEIWSFAQGGMSPIEALRTATIAPARALGFEKDLGSIEAGKLADLVIIDADVTENIFATDQVSMVMLNGRLYDAATLNETETGDRVTRPFYWQR